MNAIEITFKTTGAARTAYLAASLSPYALYHEGTSVVVGSRDTSATSLVAWFATNHGGETFRIVGA